MATGNHVDREHVDQEPQVQTSFLMPEKLRNKFTAKAKRNRESCRVLLTEFVRRYVEAGEPAAATALDFDITELHLRAALGSGKKTTTLLDANILLAFNELMINPTSEEHEHLVALIKVALKKYI